LGSDGLVKEPFIAHQFGQVRWVGPAKDDSLDRFQGPTKKSLRLVIDPSFT